MAVPGFSAHDQLTIVSSFARRRPLILHTLETPFVSEGTDTRQLIVLFSSCRPAGWLELVHATEAVLEHPAIQWW